MKTITASFALATALSAFAAAPAATAAVAPDNPPSTPATAHEAPRTEVAHGLHLRCLPGPYRGWLHRHGVWSLGAPSSIGCYR